MLYVIINYNNVKIVDKFNKYRFMKKRSFTKTFHEPQKIIDKRYTTHINSKNHIIK